MITYCKKCDINWACLKKYEDEAKDETYEVCPQCCSASYLEEGNSMTAYICNPITGRITDYDTGEPIPTQPTALPEHKKKNGYFVGMQWYPVNSYSKNPNI